MKAKKPETRNERLLRLLRDAHECVQYKIDMTVDTPRNRSQKRVEKLMKLRDEIAQSVIFLRADMQNPPDNKLVTALLEDQAYFEDLSEMLEGFGLTHGRTAKRLEAINKALDDYERSKA